MLYAKILVLLLAGGLSFEDADPYESALTAAIHHFARQGNLDHLKAILEKDPGLVDATEPLPPVHEPSGTESYTPLDWADAMRHAHIVEYLKSLKK